MRRFVGALLRRMAERVDPQKPVITFNHLGNCNDLGARIAAEIKLHNRLNGLA